MSRGHYVNVLVLWRHNGIVTKWPRCPVDSDSTIEILQQRTLAARMLKDTLTSVRCDLGLAVASELQRSAPLKLLGRHGSTVAKYVNKIFAKLTVDNICVLLTVDARSNKVLCCQLFGIPYVYIYVVLVRGALTRHRRFLRVNRL